MAAHKQRVELAMIYAPTPGGEDGFAAEQLVRMAENILGCSVSLDGVIPGAYAVNIYYKMILVNRKVPSHRLADTLIAAMNRYVAQTRIGAEPQPENVSPTRKRRFGGIPIPRRFRSA